MTLPIYNECILPNIFYPFSNTVESSTKYLGAKGLTGAIYVDLDIMSATNEEVKSLHDFWEISCNYGLANFIINIPLLGTTAYYLVQFITDISNIKNDNTWTTKIKLKVISTIPSDIVVDDSGSIVTNDANDYIVTILVDSLDDLVYKPSEVIELSNIREVIYGEDDTVKIDYTLKNAHTLTDGSRTLDNDALVGEVYDADMYSGRGIDLTDPTKSVDIPIHYTLGSELLDGVNPTEISGDEIATFTPTSSTAFDLEVTIIGTNVVRPKISKNLTTVGVTGARYLLEFDAVLNSGECILTSVNGYGGSSAVSDQIITTGSYSFEWDVTNGLIDTTTMQFNGTKLFGVSITNWSFKQVTNPDSFLTFYDLVNKETVTINMSEV